MVEILAINSTRLRIVEMLVFDPQGKEIVTRSERQGDQARFLDPRGRTRILSSAEGTEASHRL
jgi:hypothetical protein